MTFLRYPEYKDSGVEWLGEVPAHWQVKPLKRFADIDNSGSYGDDPEQGKITLPVATTAQIDAEGVFDVSKMPQRGFPESDVLKFGCNPGDILIVKSSGSAENIISGKAGLVREETPRFVFSNFLMRLKSIQGLSRPRFLYSLLISHLTKERIKQMCSTTTYPNLQVGLYVSAKLPCPPIEEQENIETFLDHKTARIDALIKEQQRLIELLKEKRQAVISHAVTKGLNPDVPMKDSGVEWLGEVPAHWKVLPLKYVTSCNDDVLPDNTPADYQLRYVEISDVDEQFGITGWTEHVFASAPSRARRMVRHGDVLISTVRTYLRAIAPVLNPPENLVASTGFAAIRPIPGLFQSGLLGYTLRADWFISNVIARSVGVSYPGINATDLIDLPVPIPPLDEQTGISAFLDRETNRIDTLVQEAESVSKLLKERRSALISAAVTGKIDVRGWQPPPGSSLPTEATATETA